MFNLQFMICISRNKFVEDLMKQLHYWKYAIKEGERSVILFDTSFC